MEINLTAEIDKFSMQSINSALSYRMKKPLGELVTVKMKYEYVPGNYRWQKQQICSLTQLRDYVNNVLPSLGVERAPKFYKSLDKLKALLTKIDNGYIPPKLEKRDET